MRQDARFVCIFGCFADLQWLCYDLGWSSPTHLATSHLLLLLGGGDAFRQPEEVPGPHLTPHSALNIDRYHGVWADEGVSGDGDGTNGLCFGPHLVLMCMSSRNKCAHSAQRHVWSTHPGTPPLLHRGGGVNGDGTQVAREPVASNCVSMGQILLVPVRYALSKVLGAYVAY